MQISRSCTFFETFRLTHPRSTDGADKEELTKMACSRSVIETDSPDCEEGSNKFFRTCRFLSCCTHAMEQKQRGVAIFSYTITVLLFCAGWCFLRKEPAYDACNLRHQPAV